MPQLARDPNADDWRRHNPRTSKQPSRAEQIAGADRLELGGSRERHRAGRSAIAFGVRVAMIDPEG